MDKHTHVAVWNPKSVALIKRKSSGAFSQVYIGKKGPARYAIKIFNDYETRGTYNPLDRDDLPSCVSEENAFLNLPPHPNIIILAGKYIKNHVIHFAYELGKKSMHAYDPEDADPFIRQILRGLRHCHANNVIHMDLKPDNIIMINDNQVKLADFGHAYVSPNVYAKHPFTYEKTTLWYRSPEQLFHMYYSGYSDIWSMGCIIYELYVGKYFCQTDNEMEMALRMFRLYGTDAIPEEYKQSKTAPLKIPQFPVVDCLGEEALLIPEQYRDILRRMLDADHDKRPDIFEVCEIYNVDAGNATTHTTVPNEESEADAEEPAPATIIVGNILDYIKQNFGEDSYLSDKGTDPLPFCDIITNITGVDKVCASGDVEYSPDIPFPCFYLGRNITFEGIDRPNFSYEAIYLAPEVIIELRKREILYRANET